MTETTNKPEEPKERGTAWMEFYVNWRFPIGFVLGGLSIINFLFNFNSSYACILLLLYVPFYIFGFFVYSAMRKRLKDGYEMNVVFLLLEAFIYSVSEGLQTQSYGYAALALAIFLLLWVWPNYVYFKHRKYLFDAAAPEGNGSMNAACAVVAGTTPKPETGEISVMEDKPEQLDSICETALEESLPENPAGKSKTESAEPKPAVLYCKKCGARLWPDSAYCDQCGAKVN